MSPKYAKSPVACLTSETSAVVCLGLAQTGRWGIFPHTSKKLNAVAMTTAVDHGKMIWDKRGSLGLHLYQKYPKYVKIWLLHGLSCKD